MTRHEYRLVDVFTDRAFGGNPLAVFADAREVPEALFPHIANELNLSETVFVLPPEKDGDHRLRIFTPAVELPFAGHPTVGTAYVLAAGGDATLFLEERVGTLRVTVNGAFAQMEQPLPEFGTEIGDLRTLAEALSLDPSDVRHDLPIQTVSCGVPFLFIPLVDLSAIRRVVPRLEGLDRAVYVFTTETVDPTAAVHGRMFGGGLGIHEDPATGGANGPLGAYLVRHGVVPPGPMTSEQGFEMGRPSVLHIEIDGTPERITGVRVGGRCVLMGGGWLDL